jgi:hypothetical protein
MLNTLVYRNYIIQTIVYHIAENINKKYNSKMYIITKIGHIKQVP